MNIPDELRYTADHEWVRIEGATATVGITDYAQDALGDVVFVQLPEIGGTLAIGAIVGEIESTKSVSDVYAPLSGVVTAVNGLVVDGPSLVNSDPYGKGWFFVLQLDDPSAVPSLLDAAAYRAVTQ